MIAAQDFITPARALGFRTWAGVPCSFLTPFINSVIGDPQMTWISSANEGDAVATASGAALAGQRSVAIMQNSGLGNALSPLSSLNWVFRLPVLLIITLRGEPGRGDEPQHELMGRITTHLLDTLEIPWSFFPRETAEIEAALQQAVSSMDRTALPYAFIMRRDSVAPEGLGAAWMPAAGPAAYSGEFIAAGAAALSRNEALRVVVENTPASEFVVIGTTGYTGRELYAIADRPNQLYLVGSMGCASSLALGLSLALPGRRVCVVDGDGAALMRMGNFATIGAYGKENLLHLLLDNQAHESTGGQHTVSAAISFAAVASACGYASAREATSSADLAGFLRQPAGPAFLQLRIRAGTPAGLPRPKITPVQVRRRLMEHIGVATQWSQR